jgi:CRP-like cAMP-binding protein
LFEYVRTILKNFI